MSDRPPERWIFACDIRVDGPPPAVVVRRLLKHLLRRWGIKCRGYSEDRRMFELTQEIERQRKLIDGLAARVAQQSELLSRRAEKGYAQEVTSESETAGSSIDPPEAL